MDSNRDEYRSEILIKISSGDLFIKANFESRKIAFKTVALILKFTCHEMSSCTKFNIFQVRLNMEIK